MIAQGQVHVVGMTELGEDPEVCISAIKDAANSMDQTGWQPFAHEFRAVPGASSTKIRTAVLSRFPLSETASLSDYSEGFCVDLYKPATGDGHPAEWITVPSTAFSRPIAKVQVTPPNGGKAFNLFVVHLKSKRPRKAEHDGNNEAIGIARSAIQRNVEAAALRYYLDSFLPQQYEADSDVATLVVGDFNDTPSSVPLENIRGPFDKVPGPGSPWSRLDKLRLLNCARLHLKVAAYEDKLYSYVHNESFSLLDMAFASEHLVRRFVRMEVYNDHVFRHSDMSSATGQEQQWKSQVSDHGVVVIEFNRMLNP
ncbi:MAG: endonuclease/exonuclease/phosphatase family protein [Planctomycetota bacterium]